MSRRGSAGTGNVMGEPRGANFASFKWWRVTKRLNRRGALHRASKPGRAGSLFRNESTRATASNFEAAIFRIFGFGFTCSRSCEWIFDHPDHFSNLLVTSNLVGRSS